MKYRTYWVAGLAGTMVPLIIGFWAYSKKGPFTNSVTPPGIDASLLNGIENYLNSGAAKSGVPLISWFGPYSVLTSSAFFNHNLKDATGANVKPDLVVLAMSVTVNTVNAVTYEGSSMTTTQVKMQSNFSPVTTTGIALKF